MKYIGIGLLALLLGLFPSCGGKQSITQTGFTNTVSKVYFHYEDLLPRMQREADDQNILVVNFWATWCGQCRKEIPDMVQLDEKYRNSEEVEVLFVNVDEFKRQHLVNPFLEEYGIKGTVVSLIDPDQDKWVQALHPGWNGQLPGTLFIMGEHRKFYNYPLSYNVLERSLDFMRAKR